MPFHHRDGPLLQVDWSSLGGLQEVVPIVEFPRRGSLVRLLEETLGDEFIEDDGECLTLW